MIVNKKIEEFQKKKKKTEWSKFEFYHVDEITSLPG